MARAKHQGNNLEATRKYIESYVVEEIDDNPNRFRHQRFKSKNRRRKEERYPWRYKKI